MNDVRVDRRRSTRSVVGLERRDEQINPKKNPRRRNKNLMIDVRVDRRRSTRSVVDLRRRIKKKRVVIVIIIYISSSRL